jgi:hypothetical protein
MPFFSIDRRVVLSEIRPDDRCHGLEALSGEKASENEWDVKPVPIRTERKKSKCPKSNSLSDKPRLHTDLWQRAVQAKL